MWVLQNLVYAPIHAIAELWIHSFVGRPVNAVVNAVAHAVAGFISLVTEPPARKHTLTAATVGCCLVMVVMAGTAPRLA